MSLDLLWAALALVLVIEGLFPFLSPERWRTLFLRVTALSDEQIRFAGLVSMGLGLLGLLWLS